MTVRYGHFALYLLLFALSVAIPSLNAVCMMAIIGLNLIQVLFKSKVEFAVLSTMVMGSELYALLNAAVCILGLLIIKRVSVKQINQSGFKVKGGIVITICLLIVNSVINGFLNNTLINFAFYAGYLLILYICFYAFNGTLNKGKAVAAIKEIIIIELIVTMIRIGLSRSLKPGDYFAGSLNNAHFFGNWIILTGVFLIIYYREEQLRFWDNRISKKELLLYILILGLMLIFADAKQIILSLVIAAVFYYFIKLLYQKKRMVVFWAFVGIYCIFFIMIWICSLDPVKTFLLAKFPVYSRYLYEEGWNGRYAFAYGTLFDSLANIRLLFGYGLGQYGSRVSNAFAYDVMWRADNFINNFIAGHFQPHVVPQFARFVSYYDDAFVEMIRYRSAVLSYPFSSFIALLGETGVVGTVLLALIINKRFKKSNARFIIVYFLSICVFDVYFDDFQCVIAAILYMGLLDGKIQLFGKPVMYKP